MQTDKIYHIVACTILASFNPLIAVVAAFGKEFYDKYVKRTKFDWYDILADAVGTISGTIIWYLIK